MKKIATDAIRATSLFLDPSRLNNNFEIFGLDFMIDCKFKTYLIEINTNPCLETGCPTLDRVIPNMLENAFRVGLDPIFPPPQNFPNSKKHYISENAMLHNNFELVFDELVNGPELSKLFREAPLARTEM
jgi:tubulin polyglutamylase TTLL1